MVNSYIQQYQNDIDINGLDTTWDKILENTDEYSKYMLENASEMYEYGLAYHNKEDKKKLGKYYTPSDTGHFMATELLDTIKAWGTPYENMNYLEPCVGVGDLLLELLAELNVRGTNIEKIISERLEISDIDETALKIASARVKHAYGIAPAKTVKRDFVKTPPRITKQTAIIMNPPYGRTEEYINESLKTTIIKDYYPMFMEIASNAGVCIAITPHSFISSQVYAPLRKTLSEVPGGTIYSYDNVPASMFNGRKHGIFNTNTSNSVRAAITLIDSHLSKEEHGYLVSPLLRWKSDERSLIFDASKKSVIGSKRQSGEHPWMKLPSGLWSLFEDFQSNAIMSDLTCDNGEYALYVPGSLRYYVSASKRELSRSSQHVLYFENEINRDIANVLLNSNISYCFWRAYDGGITITRTLLLDMPIPCLARDGKWINDTIKEKVLKQAEKLDAMREECVTQKKNAGKMNENIRYPQELLAISDKTLVPDLTNAQEEVLKMYKSPTLLAN